MNPITFHVDGEPVPQPRPRARAFRLGKDPTIPAAQEIMQLHTMRQSDIEKILRKHFGRDRWTSQLYNPSDADGWKSLIGASMRCVLPAQPIEGPVAMNIIAKMPRPQSHYGTGRNAGILKSHAPFWHTSLGDVDNISKAIMDACTTTHVWLDDKQVARLIIDKPYANGKPGADITITPLANEQLTFGEVA